MEEHEKSKKANRKNLGRMKRSNFLTESGVQIQENWEGHWDKKNKEKWMK